MPLKAWSKKKYVDYLRTIESKVIVLNKYRRKFHLKGDEYILVG